MCIPDVDSKRLGKCVWKFMDMYKRCCVLLWREKKKKCDAPRVCVLQPTTNNEPSLRGGVLKGGVHTTLKPMMMLYFSIFSALFSFFFLQPFELFLSIPFLHVVDPLQSACLPVNPPDPLPLLLLSFAIRAVSRHVRREIKLVGSSSKLTTNINTCS